MESNVRTSKDSVPWSDMQELDQLLFYTWVYKIKNLLKAYYVRFWHHLICSFFKNRWDDKNVVIHRKDFDLFDPFLTPSHQICPT